MEDRQVTPIHILLVEDNADDVLLTTTLLRHAKIMNRIDVARDGEEAAAYLRQEWQYTDKPRPDLILLDLNLPKKDGRVLLMEIKADPDLRDIPVVIQTVSEDETEIPPDIVSLADHLVAKPVDLDRLIRIVHAIDAFGLSVVRR